MYLKDLMPKTAYVTKSGVQIGILCIPKQRVEMSRDALRLQAALLEKRLPLPKVLGAIWRLL